MTPVTETALPKRGTGGREDRNGIPIPLPSLEEMRRPKRYVNGRPVPVEVLPDPTPTVSDELDKLEIDVKRNAARLREAVGRLSLDALTDDAVREELADCEHQLSECELELVRIAAARTERGRRALEAAAEAEAEARAVALAEARRLQTERLGAVRSIDGAARKLAHALSDYSRICGAQQRELRAGGRSGGGPAPSSAIERGLARAFTDAQVPRGMLDLPALSGPPALLADLDPRHVEAAEGK